METMPCKKRKKLHLDSLKWTCYKLIWINCCHPSMFKALFKHEFEILCTEVTRTTCKHEWTACSEENISLNTVYDSCR